MGKDVVARTLTINLSADSLWLKLYPSVFLVTRLSFLLSSAQLRLLAIN